MIFIFLMIFDIDEYFLTRIHINPLCFFFFFFYMTCKLNIINNSYVYYIHFTINTLKLFCTCIGMTFLVFKIFAC